jgi:predicted ATPase
VAVLSPMRRAIQVTRHRRAVPLLPEQAHASPFRLSHSPLAPSAGLEPRNHPPRRRMLCSGSRRGLERHHTLRHAVAWSYDLLDDAKRMLLDRCAVFAGGFDSKCLRRGRIR